jgi:hypothetical protein
LAAASAPAQIGRNVLANRSQRPTADDSGDVISRLAFAACFGSRCDRGLAFLRWAVWRGIASANRGSACRRVAPAVIPTVGALRSWSAHADATRTIESELMHSWSHGNLPCSLPISWSWRLPSKASAMVCFSERTGGNERCNSSKRRASSSLPCCRNHWIASP